MFCLFLAANVERKNKIPNKMLLFLRKDIVFCHLYPSGGDFRKRRNVLFHTSKCFLLKAETFFKKPVAFLAFVWRSLWKGMGKKPSGDPSGRVQTMRLNRAVVGVGSCGRWSRIVRSLEPDCAVVEADCAVVFFCIDQSMRRYCAVVATPLSAPCWQRVQTWSGRGVSECFLMLVCRILCGIQPLLQFLCGRCRVRSFRSANEWHRFPVRIPSGRS